MDENDPEFEVPVVEMNKEERVAALHDLQMQAASAKIRQKHFALFKKLNLSGPEPLLDSNYDSQPIASLSPSNL